MVVHDFLSVMQDAKQNLIERGVFVEPQALLKEMNQLMDAPMDWVSAMKLPDFSQLLILYQSITDIIASHLSVNNVITLYDLTLKLNHAFNVPDFTELQMGKLYKHPLLMPLFRLPNKNFLDLFHASSIDVYTHYAQYLEHGSIPKPPTRQHPMAMDAFLQQRQQHFCVYLEQVLKRPFNVMGIYIRDFALMNQSVQNAVAEDYSRTQKFWASVDRRLKNNYRQLVAKVQHFQGQSWAKTIEMASSQYGPEGEANLKSYDTEFVLVYERWNREYGELDFYTGALKMASSHPIEWASRIVNMAVYSVFAEYVQPGILDSDFLPPLRPEDRQLITKWTTKSKSGNWKMGDLRRYFSCSYFQTLRQRGETSEHNFDTKCILYMLAGRCILLMYMQSELKDLAAPKKTTVGELKEKIQQLLSDNPHMPLSLLEEEIQSWMEIPFIHWEKSGDRSLIEFLKGLQLEWYNQVPEDSTSKTIVDPKAIVDDLFLLMDALKPQISASIQTLESLPEQSGWIMDFINDQRFRKYLVDPTETKEPLSTKEAQMIVKKVAQKYKGMEQDSLKYQIRNSLIDYYGIFDAEEADRLFHNIVDLEYQPEKMDDLLIIMDTKDHQMHSLLNLEESIRSTPFMMDLSSVLEPYASLKSLRTHLKTISNGSEEFKLVEISCNRFIKIPRNSSVADYHHALVSRDPLNACAIWISLMLDYGSLEDLPVGLLRESTMAAYQEIVSANGHREALSNMIQILCLLPLKLSFSYFDSIVRPMVLNGLLKYSDVIHPPWNQRIRLASIGQVFSIDEWQILIKKDKSPANIIYTEPQPIHPIQKQTEAIILPTVKSYTPNPSICQSIIQSIRSEEYGFDVTLSEKESRLFKAQYERNCRAMQRLAHELYSSDSHFVFELLQNADDNVYPAQVSKIIRFIIHHQGIVVCNNESGFTEKNIRALSDVGASTKDAGSIGRKGIGFKSVFRITDAPEVHSGGFHVKFDKKDAMVPSWIDKSVAESWINFEELSQQWNTLFVLPFNDSVLQRGMDYVRDCFSEIQANVLLFLKKLQYIEMIDLVYNTRSTFQRITSGNVISILENDQQQDFYVQRVQYSPPEKEKGQVGELAIALPIHFSETLSDQSLFCYLPLRSYGFKFVIHGNFVIPSSREDVDRNSLWNEWLRSLIAPLFVSTLKSYLDYQFSQSKQEKITIINQTMRLIPTEMEVLGYFRPVAVHILQQLRQQEVLLDIQNSLCRPCDVLCFSSLQNEPLQKLCIEIGGKRVAHPSLDISPLLRTGMGMEEVSVFQLIQMLPKIHTQISLFGTWLMAAYPFVKHSEEACQLVQSELSRYPLFPIKNSRHRVALSAHSPLFYGSTKKTQLVQFSSLKNRIELIDMDILFPTNPETVFPMLEKMGIYRFDDHSYIQHNLKTLLECNALSAETLIQLTLFVADHIHDCQECPPKIVPFLRQSLKFKTNRGWKTVQEEPFIHSLVLEAPFWVYLSSDYQKAAEDQTKFFKFWPVFLNHMSISKCLSIEEKPQIFEGQGHLFGLLPSDVVQVHDWDSLEFLQIIHGFEELVKELELMTQKDDMDRQLNKVIEYAMALGSLASLLDKEWDFLECFAYINVSSSNIKLSDAKPKLSAWGQRMKESKWIPSNTGALCFPHELINLDDSFASLLSSKLQRALCPLVNQKFQDFLGIRSVPDMDHVLEFFSHPSLSQKIISNMNIAKMIPFYRDICDQNIDISSLTSIFVPLDADNGRFIPVSQCFWKDRKDSNMKFTIQNDVIVGPVNLSLLYGNAGYTLFEKLGVPKKPQAYHFALASSVYLQPFTEQGLWNSIKALQRIQLADPSIIPRDLAWLPSHRQQAVCLGQDNIYVNDDNSLSEKFAFQDIHFLHPDTRTLHSLFARLNIPFLSQSVTKIVQYTWPSQTPQILESVSNVIIFTQHILYCFAPDLYGHLIAAGIIDFLSNLKVVYAKKLWIKLSLSNASVDMDINQYLTNRLLYIREPYSSKSCELLLQIMEILGFKSPSVPQKIEDWLQSFDALSHSWPFIHEKLQNEDIYLPDSERLWCFTHSFDSKASGWVDLGEMPENLLTESLVDEPARKKRRTSQPNIQEPALAMIEDVYRPFILINTTKCSIEWSKLKTRCDERQTIKHTGLLGEEAVYVYLKDKYAADSDRKIVWVNEETETGDPYDIVIYRKNEQDITGWSVEEYIEVKATQLRWKPNFEITQNEFRFARRHRSMFTIMRVSNVHFGNRQYPLDLEVMRLNDPEGLIDSGHLKLSYSLNIVTGP